MCVCVRAYVRACMCVYVCVCVTDRQTIRQTDRDRHPERQRQRETETERQIYRDRLGGHGWGGVQSSLNLVIYKRLTIPHVLSGLYERIDHPFHPDIFLQSCTAQGKTELL